MKIFLVPVSLLVLLSACGDQTGPTDKPGKTGPNQMGRQVYETRCVVCHGSDGSSGINGAANLQLSNLDTVSLFNLIKEGRSNMPAYKDILSDDEIEQVTKYVNELKNQ